MFQVASRSAVPPLSPDVLARNAFLAAYQQLRWHLGYWGPWTACGTEEDMLHTVALLECNRVCMGPIYFNISQQGAVSGRRSLFRVQDELDRQVGAEVATAWTRIRDEMEGKRAVLMQRVKCELAHIVEVQGRVRRELADVLGVGEWAGEYTRGSAPVTLCLQRTPAWSASRSQ